MLEADDVFKKAVEVRNQYAKASAEMQISDDLQKKFDALREQVDLWVQGTFGKRDSSTGVKALKRVLSISKDFRKELAEELNWKQPEDTSMDLMLLALGTIQDRKDAPVRAIFEGIYPKVEFDWDALKETHDVADLRTRLENNPGLRNKLSNALDEYPGMRHLDELTTLVSGLLPNVASGEPAPRGMEGPLKVLKKHLFNWPAFAVGGPQEEPDPETAKKDPKAKEEGQEKTPQGLHLLAILKENYEFRQDVAKAVRLPNSEEKELAHLAVEMWRAIPAKQFIFFGPGRMRIFDTKDGKDKTEKIPQVLRNQANKPSDETKASNGGKSADEKKPSDERKASDKREQSEDAKPSDEWKAADEKKTADENEPGKALSWDKVECNLAVEFAEDPQKAVDLWDVMEWPYPFSLVLREELAQIEERRMEVRGAAATARKAGDTPAAGAGGRPPDGGSPRGDSGTSTEEPDRPILTKIRDASDRAARSNLIGVAFSGGGIRSATFNLGVLQELAKFGLLGEVDYLSTVSGGGYIGSWLTCWIYKNQFSSQKELRDGMQKLLSPKIPDPRADEQKPVRFLREFSNYLTPRLGTFSFDTWTMVSIYSRNLFLNQATLISVLGFLLLLPRFMTFSLTLGFSDWLTGVPAVLLLGLAVYCMAVNIGAAASAAERKPTGKPGAAAESKSVEEPRPTGNAVAATEPEAAAEPKFHSWARDHVKWSVVAPFLAAMYLGSVSIWHSLDFMESHPWFLLGFTFGVACFLSFLLLWRGGFIREYRRRPVGSSVWWLVLAGIVILCAAAMTGLLELDLAITCALKQPGGAGMWIAVVFSPVMLLAVMIIPAMLQVGLMGVDFPDAGREWLSRFRAICTVYSLWWMAFLSAAIFGPWLVWTAAGHIGYWTSGIAGWMVTTIGGILAGKSKRTGTDKDGTPKFSWLQVLARIGPPVFAAGLVLLIATGEQALLAHGACISMDVRSLQRASWMTLDWNTLFCSCGWYVDQPGWLLLMLGTAGMILCWRVDINEFSMHHFYKNRLVRCYLGASNECRRPNEFTGFDARDDVRLALLKAIQDKSVTEQPNAKDGEMAYLGPYPIINTTLNLSAGKQLAWQERKGTSFILSPCFCGFDVQGWLSSTAAKRTSSTTAKKTPRRAQNRSQSLSPAGYRKTSSYSHEGGPYLGTSFSISGAAANPNQGYNTSPAVAFLMTMFDVRLGWWFGNPRRKNEWKWSSPAFGLFALLRELMGLTDDTYAYVNLSDGGHFDNMGIYELVRRRCNLIVLCDAEQDQDFKFEGLGSAIRKCRIDFGASIEIDTSLIRPGKDGKSRAHCAVGKIAYVDGSEGTLVYIKSSLTGDEPADVMQYHCAHHDFPHESTADQWFTESQFESYRALGLHAAEESLKGAGAWIKWKPEEPKVSKLADALTKYWYADNPNLKDSASRNTATLVKMLDTIRTTGDLRELGNKLFPGITAPPPDQPQETQEFYFGLALLQLVEDIYFDFKLDRDEWLNDPRIGGWKDLFETWKAVPEVAMVWASTRTTFRRDFQHFWEERIQARR